MIGVLVISHGKMAEGMLDTVQMVLGEERHLDFASLAPGQDYASFERQISTKICALDSGDGVLVLADLFGASPFNVSQKVVRDLRERGIHCMIVAGVNLGMLVEIMVLREGSDLDELTDVAIASGKRGIGCPAIVAHDEDGDDY